MDADDAIVVKNACNLAENGDAVTRFLRNRVAEIDKNLADSRKALADWCAGENRLMDKIEEHLRNQDESIDITEAASGDIPLVEESNTGIEELMRKADSFIAASLGS